ncbi:MAG: response regulator [Chloroflexi bacterium]|nr:response regulator [Chloroflexota bacterium]
MPKVLLAEDDVTMVSLLKTLLKMEGFEVIVLPTDADVPGLIRSERPDVILMDVHLSRQSGLQILDAIRSSNDIHDVRIVMTSGANVGEECMKHGANGFLLKPYMPDDLVTMLKKSMNSGKKSPG